VEFSIQHSPVFSILEARFREGEVLRAQPGTMLAMSTGFDLRAGVSEHVGGSRRSVRAFRSVLAGESVFSSVYTARRDDEYLILAADEVGELIELPVAEGAQYFLSRGAYLASTESVQISVEYAGIRGWMATSGLFFMRTAGSGSVFVTSSGALVTKVFADEERMVLDNRYIVAFSDTLQFETVKVASDLKNSFLAGEGLANRFTGPGTLIYQTRPRPSRGFLRGLLDVAT
jgi:uncharacterized protein (TIGR00266 family)